MNINGEKAHACPFLVVYIIVRDGVYCILFRSIIIIWTQQILFCVPMGVFKKQISQISITINYLTKLVANYIVIWFIFQTENQQCSC